MCRLAPKGGSTPAIIQLVTLQGINALTPKINSDRGLSEQLTRRPGQVFSTLIMPDRNGVPMIKVRGR